MKYELKKIEELSGNKASIYSIAVDGEITTLFDKFVERYHISHKSEINYMLRALEVVCKQQGYRDIYFKKNEGFLGSQIEALYDKPKSKLRLYCINLGGTIIIIGGGGVKPKNKRALQEVPDLKESNDFLRRVSRDLEKKVKNKEITYSDDNMELLGNLEFEEENE